MIAPPFARTLLVLLLATLPGIVSAPPATAGPQTNEVHAASLQGVDRGTPKQTATGFLEACRSDDFERAALFVDLSEAAPEDGPKLARQLYVVLDRTLWVDLDEMSDEPAGKPQDAPGDDTDRLVGAVIGNETPPFHLRVAQAL